LQPFHPTTEDIYDAVVATDRGTADNLRFFDTEGIEQESIYESSFRQKKIFIMLPLGRNIQQG
jgi:hypothetical protein